MRFNEDKAQKEYEDTLGKAALPQFKRLETRAKELCTVIKRDFPQIHSLQMGMGAYWFESNKGTFKLVTESEEITENLCNLLNTDFHTGYMPKCGQKAFNAIAELREICDFVNDAHFMPNMTFDIK